MYEDNSESKGVNDLDVVLGYLLKRIIIHHHGSKQDDFFVLFRPSRDNRAKATLLEQAIE